MVRRLLLTAGPHRAYLLAHAQSTLGTGLTLVALMLVAYERHPSPWALSAVLGADIVPMLLGGVWFGALADRCSRRRLAVGGDVLRAVALAGVALTPSFALTVGFALLAGVGQALHRPAVKAALPTISPDGQLGAMTAAYGALIDVGMTAGAALAAGLLLLVDASVLVGVDAATFALSALLLWRLPLDGEAGAACEPDSGPAGSLLGDVRAGIAATGQLPWARALMGSSALVMLCATTVNVAEPLLATVTLGAPPSAFALLLSAYGAGMAAGALSGARPRGLGALKQRYLAAIAVAAAGLGLSALAPSWEWALAAFCLTGVGNGALLCHEQLLLQRLVPDGLLGRVYGMKGSLEAGAVALALCSAGVLVAVLGPRGVFIAASAGVGLAALVAVRALRDAA